MKNVKVTIQDENALALQEDAHKGDLIDLKSIRQTSISPLSLTS